MNTTEGLQPANILGKSLQLPCGVILKNRIAKAPMSDSLGDGKGQATEAQIRLYEKWAEGGSALSIIGEVQGDHRFPEKPGNLVMEPGFNPKDLQSLAKRARINGAHIWPQLGHGGALSHLPIGTPTGPSRLNIDGFQCEAMSLDDVQALPHKIAITALQAKSAGFNGVQIHAAHGFLLSQFLSPLFNLRQDGYGGSIEGRCRIVLEVVDAVRDAVGPTFPVGIKINSTDRLEGGLTEDEALEVIRLLDHTSIDLIDISGGTYFPGTKEISTGTHSRPYFIDFARLAKRETQIPLMLTGGFKTQKQALDAVLGGAVDMVGVARGLALNPNLARAWLATKGDDPDFPRFQSAPPGGVTAWYTMLLTALGEDREDTFSLDLATAIRLYEERDDVRCKRWSKKFANSG